MSSHRPSGGGEWVPSPDGREGFRAVAIRKPVPAMASSIQDPDQFPLDLLEAAAVGFPFFLQDAAYFRGGFKVRLGMLLYLKVDHFLDHIDKALGAHAPSGSKSRAQLRRGGAAVFRRARPQVTRFRAESERSAPGAAGYCSLARAALRALKLGRSFGVGVCSLYWMTPCLSTTNAARALTEPSPSRSGSNVP
jgi:hypothetical protein